MIKNILEKLGLVPPPYEIVMTDNEKIMFVNAVKNSMNYLEFGIGGSTLCTLENSKAKVTSVESDVTWIQKVKKYPYVKRMEILGRLSIFHIDIGPTRKWGFPKGNKHRNLYPDYSSKVFKSRFVNNVDTVFVDGRFRVACILNSIIFFHNKSLVKIIIHDFTNRPHYQMVLNYLNIVDEVDSLVICTIKKEINLNRLKSDYDYYKYIPK